jgi:hypothetical protein
MQPIPHRYSKPIRHLCLVIPAKKLVWPQQEKSMTIFRWTCLFSILVVLLSACGGTTAPTAKLTLTANLSQVASGGKVVLTALPENVTDVVSVEFAVVGQAAFFTDTKADDGFSAESAALSADTTFAATAKRSTSEVVSSNTVLVKVTAASSQPNAENKAVTTLAGVQVVFGGTPEGLAVVTDKLVVQNGTPKLKAATGGVATLESDGTFTFTPDGTANPASFEYEVVSGAVSDTGKVTITIKDLPANTKIINTLAGLTAETGAASITQTMIVSGTITCNADQDPSSAANCVVLKPNQKLIGAGVIEGVTLAGTAKIDATFPGEEGLDSNANNLTVVELAPDSTVEGIEISGRDIYTAINGVATTLSGTLTIKNVKIVGPTSNAPFAIRFLEGSTTGEYYSLNIDGLTVTDATKRMGVAAFKDLTFKNSSIAMNIPGEVAGFVIQAEGNATAVVEGIKITSAIASETFAPLKFGQASGSNIFTVSVKNTDVAFAGATDTELASANAFYFDYGNTSPSLSSKIAIDTVASTGNTSNSKAPLSDGGVVTFNATGGGDKAARITGSIEVNGTVVTR